MSSLSSRVTIANEVLFREIEGECVLLNLRSGKYFGLDTIGARMWALLSEHPQVEDVLRALVDEYDVDEERLTHDLLDLVDQLAAQDLVRVDEP